MDRRRTAAISQIEMTASTRKRRRQIDKNCDLGSFVLCVLFTFINLTLSLLILPLIWPAIITSAGAQLEGELSAPPPPAQASVRLKARHASQNDYNNQDPFLIYNDQEQQSAKPTRRQQKSLPFRSLSLSTLLSSVQGREHQLDTQQQQQTSKREAPSSSSSNSGSLLVCPEGWQQHSTQCYKFFHQRHSWQRAKETCEKYGAQLALVYDYEQNNFTSQLAGSALSGHASSASSSSSSSSAIGGSVSAAQLANSRYHLASLGGGSTGSNLLGGGGGPISQAQADASAYKLAGAGPTLGGSIYSTDGERSYWIGFRTIDRLETNTLESAANTFVSKYVGFWDYNEPRVSQGECVQATLASKQQQQQQQRQLGANEGPAGGDKQQQQQQLQQVWQLSRCEDLLPFVCQRQVCSSNSFHCSNGRCVNAAWKCDGHNDCGDDSDEMDCPRRCRFYMSSSGDKVQSINYPQRYEPNTDCKWTLEGPLDAGMMLQFYEFDTEKNYDQVQVLTGARTEDKAFSLATLSGQLNLTQRPIISGSNLMIVKFRSDSLVERRGFRASWKTEPIECGGEL